MKRVGATGNHSVSASRQVDCPVGGEQSAPPARAVARETPSAIKRACVDRAGIGAATIACALRRTNDGDAG